MVKIENYLKENGESKTNDIAEYLNLSSARTRKILSEMKTIEAIGTNTNRKYRLKIIKNRIIFKDEIKCNIYEKSYQIDSLL